MRVLRARLDTPAGRGSVCKSNLDVHKVSFFGLHCILSLESFSFLSFAIVLDLSVFFFCFRRLELTVCIYRTSGCARG